MTQRERFEKFAIAKMGYIENDPAFEISDDETYLNGITQLTFITWQAAQPEIPQDVREAADRLNSSVLVPCTLVAGYALSDCLVIAKFLKTFDTITE